MIHMAACEFLERVSGGYAPFGGAGRGGCEKFVRALELVIAAIADGTREGGIFVLGSLFLGFCTFVHRRDGSIERNCAFFNTSQRWIMRLCRSLCR